MNLPATEAITTTRGSLILPTIAISIVTRVTIGVFGMLYLFSFVNDAVLNLMNNILIPKANIIYLSTLSA